MPWETLRQGWWWWGDWSRLCLRSKLTHNPGPAVTVFSWEKRSKGRWWGTRLPLVPQRNKVCDLQSAKHEIWTWSHTLWRANWCFCSGIEVEVGDWSLPTAFGCVTCSSSASQRLKEFPYYTPPQITMKYLQSYFSPFSLLFPPLSCLFFPSALFSSVAGSCLKPPDGNPPAPASCVLGSQARTVSGIHSVDNTPIHLFSSLSVSN